MGGTDRTGASTLLQSDSRGDFRKGSARHGPPRIPERAEATRDDDRSPVSPLDRRIFDADAGTNPRLSPNLSALPTLQLLNRYSTCRLRRFPFDRSVRPLSPRQLLYRPRFAGLFPFNALLTAVFPLGFPAVPLVPASAPSSTPSAFDRFARIDNPRHDYPDVLLYVAPRFCPPDKCSGRHPLPENYELVDRYLNAYFAVSFEIRGLLRLKRAGSQLRERLLDLCWRIGNLDFESPSEKKLLHSHVVEVCRHAGDRMPASVKRSLHTLFQWVAEGLVSTFVFPSS